MFYEILSFFYYFMFVLKYCLYLFEIISVYFLGPTRSRRAPLHPCTPPVASDSDDDKPPPPRQLQNMQLDSTYDDDGGNYQFSMRGRPPRTPPTPPAIVEARKEKLKPLKQRQSSKSPIVKQPPKTEIHKLETVEKVVENVQKKRGRKRINKRPRTPSDSENEAPKVKLKSKLDNRGAKRAPSSDSDDEDWSASRKKLLLQSKSTERVKRDSSWDDKRPKRETGRPKREVSREIISTDTSSDDDDRGNVSSSPVKPVSRLPPAATRRPTLSPYADPKKEESPPKLDVELKNRDKKKNDTLRRLFRPLRDNEGGGKGGKGGKGGGKGKGKGGKTPGVLVVECDSERTSPYESPDRKSVV